MHGVVQIYAVGASPLYPACKEHTCQVRPRQTDGLYLVSSGRISLYADGKLRSDSIDLVR